MGILNSIKSVFRKATPAEHGEIDQKIKSGLMSVIKWDPEGADSADIVAYKHDIEDFNDHSVLIVHESQVAVIFRDGKAERSLGSGRWVLDSNNIAGANGLLRAATGGQTIYHCEVYFINLIRLKPTRWGTTSPIRMNDPVYNIAIHVRARGYFAAHIGTIRENEDGIDDAKKFLERVVGTQKVFTTQQLEEYLRVKIPDALSSTLAATMTEKQIGILDIHENRQTLASVIQERLVPYFSEFGVVIHDFSFEDIMAPDEDLAPINEERLKAARAKQSIGTAQAEAEAEAIRMERLAEAEAKKMRMMGYTYQQEKSFDVMKTAAGNTGSGSDFMGAGMGLGMGVGMGRAFGMGMNNMAQGAMNTANTATAPCPNCGTPVAAGAQFCSGCGQKIAPAGNACKSCGATLPAGTKFCPMCGAKAEPQGVICPGCGQELPAGSKFCSGCGQKLVAICKGCGKELAPGTKFCDNCGTPAQ